jgi:putative endonuclease
MKSHNYYVYILASLSRRLYVGVTGNLSVRVAQHKVKETPGFTSRYSIDRLVYCELFERVEDALVRGKQIKGWTRAKKIELIEGANPGWEELSVGR